MSTWTVYVVKFREQMWFMMSSFWVHRKKMRCFQIHSINKLTRYYHQGEFKCYSMQGTDQRGTGYR